MTTTLESRGRAPSDHYRLAQVARAEIAKIASLRSTVVICGFTLVGALLVTGLVTNSQLHHSARFYDLGYDPTQNALTGMVVAALTGGVFGALLVTGEYSSSTMRTTLAATPRRSLLVATKVGVAAVLTAVFCEVLSFLSFFLGKIILSHGGAPSANLGSPGALRAVIMTGLFIALMALMSFGFGLIFRHTAAAITAFAAVVFVLPLVARGISQHALRYLPTNILTNSITSTVDQGGGPGNMPISPALGLALMALYAAVALGIGVLLFNRRDA